MSNDLDPGLQILFANAERDLAGEAFVPAIMAAMDKRRRRRRFALIGAGVAALVAAWLLAAPLHSFVQLFSQGLTLAIVPGGEGIVTQLLAPLNSIAGLLALCLLAGQMLWRRLRG